MPPTTELHRALRTVRAPLIGMAGLSALVNLLYLTGSFFMLEVYDRVVPSRSLPTLVGLCVLALTLYAFQGALETFRARIAGRLGLVLDERLARSAFALTLEAPLRMGAAGDGLFAIRDLDQIRVFLAGGGPSALFDLPWMPVYVAICFLFHPLIGAAAIGAVAVLATLTAATEIVTRALHRASTIHGARRMGLAEAGRRNAEAVAAMGMQGALFAQYAAASADYLHAQQRLADLTGGFGSASKVFRMALQSGVLALGAWLLIEGQASSGIMIAASILVSRALAPAEVAIANWKAFVAARQGWARLAAALARLPAEADRHALEPPRKSLTVEAVSVAPPGTQRLVVQEVGFTLAAGQALGVIGPSASGKSSLGRVLAKIWTPARGTVRLDGAALDQWSHASLGPHLGYLPQHVELFAGTIAQNIARFDPAASAEAVTAAARAAGAHELILRLSEGYDTPIGPDGAGLSAGQGQRIGLARALYGNPFLVVLDEPNANLDGEGEAALTQAIAGVRTRGGICVVIAHRPSALAAVDLVLVMGEGRAVAFGPRDEVLRQVMRPAPVPSPTAKAAPTANSERPGHPLKESA
ncbi:type I secretion system permease/ATPase [Methylobacterium sp. SD21]|uniref:type I secretion system permease/ATPase n=1 Tax=Methylobacterium litchii TaxID=3138810 RepID=UPI00313D4283